MKTLCHRLVAMVLVLSPLGALAQGAPAKTACDPKATLPNLQKTAALGGGYSLTAPTCTSLRNVFARLFGASASAGKKLEQDKALNVAAATKERQDALADADFAAALKDVLTGETDPLRRLVLEAALHEEYGNYAARDLLLRDARVLMEK